ncbi:MAG: DUF362 domain-containing protein [Candidatus Omnitrophica bacterium]|nr:DUF362 domain-containing protein [Candidatus Omnitrophota bacterium]
MTANVALKKTTTETLRADIESTLGDSGCLALLKAGDRVLFKPNLVTDKKEYIDLGANTSLEVLEGLLQILSDIDCSIGIVESETGTPAKGRRLRRTWELMKLPEVAQRYGADLINLTQEPRTRLDFPGSRAPQLELPVALFECDRILNIPKIKTHKYATLTCCIKNLFGLLPEPRRIVYHNRMQEIIVELAKTFDDKLIHLVDGLIAMEGNGPLYGKAVEMNVLLAGKSAWAIDRTVCDLIELDPRKVRYLSIGKKRGLEQPDIEVTGDSLPDLKRRFEPVAFNAYRLFEKKLMETPLVHLITSHWFQRHISSHLGGVTERLRGGGYSWYLDEEQK